MGELCLLVSDFDDLNPSGQTSSALFRIDSNFLLIDLLIMAGINAPSPLGEDAPSLTDTPSTTEDDASPAEPFPLTRLPPELQAMVWEMTYPDPRVIEIVERWPDFPYCRSAVNPNNPGDDMEPGSLDDTDDTDNTDNTGATDDTNDTSDTSDTDMEEETQEYMGLQLAGSLSTFMEINHSPRGTWTEPYEASPLPVALHVCRATRTQALRRYIPMIDPITDRFSFYIDPRRDVLWLSLDITDEGAETVAQPRQQYGQQIDRIENVLVEEQNWDDRGGPAEYCTNFLDSFRGLKVVSILLESYGYADMSPTDPATFPGLAHSLADRDKALLGRRNWTMEYIDRDDNIYEQVFLADGEVQ